MRIQTIIICVLLCLLIPIDRPGAAPQSSYVPTTAKTPKTQPAVMAANSTERGFVVIDTAGYESGTYVLQLDLRDDSWALKTLTAVTLQGTPARPQPVPDEPKPDEPTPDTPSKPGDLENEVLADIREQLSELDELETFEQQLELMRAALELPQNTADPAAMHAWVQKGFQVALREHADVWKPWTDWYNQGADETGSGEDYRVWVQLAKESLK